MERGYVYVRRQHFHVACRGIGRMQVKSPEKKERRQTRSTVSGFLSFGSSFAQHRETLSVKTLSLWIWIDSSPLRSLYVLPVQYGIECWWKKMCRRCILMGAFRWQGRLYIIIGDKSLGMFFFKLLTALWPLSGVWGCSSSLKCWSVASFLTCGDVLIP